LRNDGRDFTRRQTLADQLLRDRRQLPPRAPEIVHIPGLIDLVAELDGAFGAQLQQIARGQSPGNMA
jgi:hypothetical protein